MPLYVLIVLVFFGIVSILFFLIYLFLPKKTALMERLESLASYMDEGVVLEKPFSAWNKFLGRLGKNLPLRPQDYGKYMKMLIAAGIRKDRYQIFMGSKILLTIFLPIAYLAIYGIPVEKNFTIRSLLTVAFAIIGFLIPSLWLSNKVKKRRAQIFHDLPHFLDLMTVCVEAGLSIDSAVIKVSEDPLFRKSALSNEMRIAVQETIAGKPRLEALRDMGDRTMLEDLKSFAALLIQTERLGTSVAQSLRVHADSLRTIRMQMAQEEAAKTTIKLLFPLVFFIFPALLVVMLGPALIRLSKMTSLF
jgi:tight adherence protein C